MTGHGLNIGLRIGHLLGPYIVEHWTIIVYVLTIRPQIRTYITLDPKLGTHLPSDESGTYLTRDHESGTHLPLDRESGTRETISRNYSNRTCFANLCKAHLHNASER
ncbi:hypothetical protein CEXT_373771 [Caerostris extrusa]|uniref:Uncharacterized protein n=1 Tax=Caerostris extrusa TaxID=172846 RepID=A0AAV4WU88_CAEEX|nr:hypothetical protein CEXT_373771 [Caerostris extrusa]